MSGIVGAFIFDGNDFVVTAPYLTDMRGALAHRGSDGDAWVADDGRVGLGHCRHAHGPATQTDKQPLSSADGALRLCFDGQIYNHMDVRAELDRLEPRPWRSERTHGEVVLRAFQQWGMNCLEKFNGCFAIALWDSRSRELWLARDRVGIKPLYYSTHNGRITFASEIKALLKDPQQSRAVDEEAVFHYLSFLVAPAPLTMFQGIEKLPCGTWMRVSTDGQVESRRYWDPLDGTISLSGLSDDEICERIVQDLRRSVALRANGDGPVGAFLSGGLDSGINAALLSEVAPSPLQTFTYSFDVDYEPYRREVDGAKRMAERLGYDNFDVILTIDDVLDSLPKTVRLIDEPISDPHCISFFHLAKLSRRHGVVACQNTIGADELFMGIFHWPTWIRLERMNAWPVPSAMKRLGLGGLRLAGRGQTFAYERLRRAVDGEALFWNGVEMFPDAHKKFLLSDRMRRKFARHTSFEAIRPVRQAFLERSEPRAYLSWMTYMDLHLHTPEHQLMRSDKASSGAGHETRFPFLDHKFIELAMSIPQGVHLRPGTLKPVLEKIGRSLLPYELVQRSQMNTGFPYPWIFGRIGDYARQELDSFCRKTDLFDRTRVLQLVDRMQETRTLHLARQSWCLLVLAAWWAECVDAS